MEVSIIMKNLKMFFTAAVVPAVLAAGSGQLLAKKANNLTMSGSTTVLPIAQRAAEVFMDKNPDANISVRGGGSGVGIAAIVDGTVNIADSSRPIQTKEMLAAKQKGRNIREYAIAKDGLAIIVNKKNEVKGLTLKQLSDIFLGKIGNWKDVGGPNMAIVVVSRDTSSGTFETFMTKVLKGAKVVAEALMLASNKAVLTTVADTPGAIGYVGIGFLSPDVNDIPVEGLAATSVSVKNGTYKISRSLYMYVNGEPSGLTKQFLDFVLSDEGQKIVEEVGYVSIR
jgi:phosphate transport system substrate-binding protein